MKYGRKQMLLEDIAVRPDRDEGEAASERIRLVTQQAPEEPLEPPHRHTRSHPLQSEEKRGLVRRKPKVARPTSPSAMQPTSLSAAPMHLRLSGRKDASFGWTSCLPAVRRSGHVALRALLEREREDKGPSCEAPGEWAT